MAEKTKIMNFSASLTQSPTMNKKIYFNLHFIILTLSVVSLLSYLLLANNTNTLGIVRGEMQMKITKLQDQNRDLETAATQLESMQRVQALATSQLSMVSSQTYDYVLPTNNAVAVK